MKSSTYGRARTLPFFFSHVFDVVLTWHEGHELLQCLSLPRLEALVLLSRHFAVGLSPIRSILHDEIARASRSCDEEFCCERPRRKAFWFSHVTTRLLHLRREAVLDHQALNQHFLCALRVLT
jgi:hypothetical protein